MHHFFEALTNTSGESLIGYFGRVINTSTQAIVTLASDDNGTPIATISGVADMAKTDAEGNLDFYVAPGTYHLDLYAPDAVTFIRRVSNVAMNSSKGDKGDAGDIGDTGPSNNTRVDLAALKAAAITDKTSLYDGSLWTWMLGNYTGLADDLNVVKANSTALSVGAWFRQRADGITALLAIPGAVVQSQAQINAVTVSVLSFGADPTGVADSTAAFNLATGAAQTHTGNSTILKRLIRVPAGKYRIDGKVYVRRGQQVMGDGWATSHIDFTSSISGGFVLGCGNTGTVDPGGLGAVVSGLFFYGNASPAIDASKPDSWGVIDCMLTECGVGVRAGGTDGNISRCIFDGGDIGVDWYAGHSHRCSGNLFFNVNTDMRVYSDACDILLTGNLHQYSEVTSLQLMVGATGIRNLIVADNLFMMNAQYAGHVGFIFINATGADIQVKGNSFRNGKGLALSYGGGLGNRLVFTGNTIDGAKTTSSYDQSTGSGGLEVSNMDATIAGNEFRNLPGPVIFCAPSSATKVRVLGNVFQANSGGATEIQITTANGASAVSLDDSNTSDRAIVPAQTGVPVFAPRIASGRVALVAGQATIALPITRTSSRVLIQRYADGGTVGASYSVSRTPGTGFTIQAKDGAGANQTGDTSTVDWTVDLMGV